MAAVFLVVVAVAVKEQYLIVAGIFLCRCSILWWYFLKIWTRSIPFKSQGGNKRREIFFKWI